MLVHNGAHIADHHFNMVCLDYRASASVPAVVHWDHEQDPAQAITPVAASFSGFLTSLHE